MIFVKATLINVNQIKKSFRCVFPFFAFPIEILTNLLKHIEFVSIQICNFTMQLMISIYNIIKVQGRIFSKVTARKLNDTFLGYYGYPNFATGPISNILDIKRIFYAYFIYGMIG